jgi:hypothetical protein
MALSPEEEAMLKLLLKKMGGEDRPATLPPPPMQPDTRRKSRELSEEELYDRQMKRLRAKERAQRDFKARKIEELKRNLPQEYGLWHRVDVDTDRDIMVTPAKFWLPIKDGQLMTVPPRSTSELEGEWTLVEYVCGKTYDEYQIKPIAVSNEMRSSVNEHLRRTAKWRDRADKLAAIGQRPCANYDCDAVLLFDDTKRFCDQCSDLLDLAGNSG